MYKKFSSLLIALLIMTITTIASAAQVDYLGDAKLVIDMLNVGQGDSILVRSDSKTMLVDTGDVDRNTQLMLELQKLNVSHIDYLVLTHPHADHIGGVAAVLTSGIQVDYVIDNGVKSNSPVYRQYMQIVKNKGFKHAVFHEGNTLNLDDTVLTALSAPNTVSDFSSDSVNDSSIVLGLKYLNFSMLLMGDAEASVEDYIINKYDISNTNVLKVGHHGSHSSSTPEFLNASKPEVALISCGIDNPYHHPHPVTMKKLNKFGCKVYRTDVNGTIEIRTDGTDYSVNSEY